jgi:hypothetical protein
MCNGVSGSMKGAEIVDELGYTLKLAWRNLLHWASH